MQFFFLQNAHHNELFMNHWRKLPIWKGVSVWIDYNKGLR